ncbi:MAG: amino acid ABC transporter permease [Spirochaetota bacterium]
MRIKHLVKKLFFHPPGSTSVSRYVQLANILLVGVLLAAAFFLGFSSLSYQFQWENVWLYRESLIEGFVMTIVISLASLCISTLLGLFFGLSQRSSFLPLRIFSRFYVEGIRGTPLLVQILIFFYVMANAVGLNNRYVSGIFIMSIFAGAYIAEIIRSGVESVGSTQRETARSIGLTKRQTYRFIIFPQVITRVLPPLTGQFASLIKDSSLLSIIAIKEFTLAAREINANTFSTLESYIPLAAGYLLLTIPISYLTKRLEKRFFYET